MTGLILKSRWEARGTILTVILSAWQRWNNLFRIIEQCFQQIPDGAVAADLTGCVIPASQMVDSAKMGQTEGLIEDEVTLDPTLQGSTRKYHDAINADRKDVVLPAKENTYGNIEGLMNHFKLVMYGHGIRPPVGEVYFPVEGANGELGFYIVSDGSDRPGGCASIRRVFRSWPRYLNV